MLTPRQINEAIAIKMNFVKKVVPFDFMGEKGMVDNWTLYNDRGEIVLSHLPDFCGSRDALAAAENWLFLKNTGDNDKSPQINSEAWTAYVSSVMAIDRSVYGAPLLALPEVKARLWLCAVGHSEQ